MKQRLYKMMIGLPVPIFVLLAIIYTLTSVFVQNEEVNNIAFKAEKRPGSPLSPLMNAVVHVGPHKTGTTTIQDFSLKIADKLALDNYEMPWYFIFNQTNDKKFPRSNLVHFATCFFSETNNPVQMKADQRHGNNTYHLVQEYYPCRPNYKHVGQEIANRHHSLLLSTEVFDQLDLDGIEALSQYLTPWQNVTIVVVYRRYYEWLISYHHELSKGNFLTFFHSNETQTLRPSIVDALLDPEWMGIISNHYALPVTKRFQQYFENVEVINMHDGDMKKKGRNIVEVFYCDMIPHAPHACQEVERIKKVKELNKSRPLVYEDIAYAAYHRGMIDMQVQSKKQLQLVITQIREHQEMTLNKSSSEFKHRCPPFSVLEDIYQTSMKAERELFPDFFASGDGQVELKRGFDEYSKTFLCEVDIVATLESSDWRNFFQSLAKNHEA